jgi:hypothetical protein
MVKRRKVRCEITNFGCVDSKSDYGGHCDGFGVPIRSHYSRAD